MYHESIRRQDNRLNLLFQNANNIHTRLKICDLKFGKVITIFHQTI